METFNEKSVKTVEPSKRQYRAKLRKDVIKFWKTNITLFKIAKILQCRQPTVKQIFTEEFGKEEVIKRSKRLYKQSKLGNKNPMKGKFGENHPNWKSRSTDKKGYFTVVKPTWWAGDNKGNRVFEHHVICCKKYGLTSIPKGFEIHHVDNQGENNSPDNLLLIEKVAHRKLHQILRKCNDHSEKK